MSRDEHLLLEDIRESCRKILRFTRGYTKDEFVADDRTFDAVVRNLEVIGEAVKKLPSVFKERYSEVPWKKIAGLRDIVAHEYFGIDEDIVWDIVVSRIPELLYVVENSLSEGPDQS